MLYALAGLLVGGILMWSYMYDVNKLKVQVAEEKERNAHRINGKLAKRIHKQRLMIKTLKANQIPQTKKPYASQPSVSH